MSDLRFVGRLAAGVASMLLLCPGRAEAIGPTGCGGGGPPTMVYPASGSWAADLRGLAAGAITGANPRSGNGSLELATTGSLTDWAFFQRAAAAGGWGLLSEISCLQFDWYRQSITTPVDAPWLAQTPVLRLWVQDGDQQSELVWEKYYSDNSAAATDQWVVQDVLSQNLWRHVTGQGYTIADCANADPFFPNPLLTLAVGNWASSGCFSSRAFVYAIAVGVGSNWPHQYRGFADNIQLGFSDQTTLVVNDNFELPQSAVPEPTTLVMVGTGLAGVMSAAWLKRKKKRSVA